MNIPTIKTGRLVLRPFQLQDADPLHEILSIPGLLEYYPNPEPPDLERVQKLVQGQIDHWSEYGYGWWAVEPNGNDELIGWSGLQYLTETDEIEIGYLLSKSYWGMGLATESAAEGLDYGFRKLKIQEIVGIVHPENISSQKVLEKIGLEYKEEAEYFGMACYKYLIKNPN
jgi:ribosomal-protein-alanine N-acetyltransferase